MRQDELTDYGLSNLRIDDEFSFDLTKRMEDENSIFENWRPSYYKNPNKENENRSFNSRTIRTPVSYDREFEEKINNTTERIRAQNTKSSRNPEMGQNSKIDTLRKRLHESVRQNEELYISKEKIENELVQEIDGLKRELNHLSLQTNKRNEFEIENKRLRDIIYRMKEEYRIEKENYLRKNEEGLARLKQRYIAREERITHELGQKYKESYERLLHQMASKIKSHYEKKYRDTMHRDRTRGTYSYR
eukprot:GHVP01056221.1.p1 GENE.GHVP01056221.1~~GHVP01056221.1.p1  ORF type:complete len:247 (-),score=52.58 GHVP01056221.1:266-1006(-)